MSIQDVMDSIRYKLRYTYYEENQKTPVPDIFVIIEYDLFNELRAVHSMGPLYRDELTGEIKLDGFPVIPYPYIRGWRVVV